MNEDIGFSVLRLRRQRRWTQDELARRAGVSISTVRRVELATHVPDTRTLARIADALGVGVGDLMPAGSQGEAVRPGTASGTLERTESAVEVSR